MKTTAGFFLWNRDYGSESINISRAFLNSATDCFEFVASIPTVLIIAFHGLSKAGTSGWFIEASRRTRPFLLFSTLTFGSIAAAPADAATVVVANGDRLTSEIILRSDGNKGRA